MANTFLDDDYLLDSATARALFHGVAACQPIIDYHNHLSPQDIAENRRFDNLTRIWLEGDHYKWRAMRINGIEERLITGKDSSDREKFDAWAATVPKTMRNPIFTWTHLELRRHFGITDLLEPASAAGIWERANDQLAGNDLSVHGILGKMRVKVLCTTDDPADPLDHHHAIARSGLATRVYPTFRADQAFTVDDAPRFNAWCDRLERASGVAVDNARTLLAALAKRHDDFHAAGCRVSDNGMERMFAAECGDAEADAIMAKVRGGTSATAAEREKLCTHVMLHLGRWNAAKGWAMQLHLGPIRNLNTRLARAIGADAGTDAMGDASQARPLAWFLDRLDRDDCLPKTILYNLNPRDNALFAALTGCFQQGPRPGKIQWGSGWWFLDQEDGMRAQIETLSQLGLLARFVGMLTDSRSFLSFPRHELFRRILCSMLGKDVESGRLPDRQDMLAGLVADVCYGNARGYFGFDHP